MAELDEISADRPVLVITGWSGEAKRAHGPNVLTFCSGGRALSVDRLVNWHPGPAAAVISFGLAGGLDPSLRPGTIIVGSGLISGSGYHSADPKLAAGWSAKLSAAGIAHGHADLASSDAVLTSKSEKQDLARRTGALAVDMESETAALLSARLGARFGILRAVADPAWRGLPSLVASGLSEDGSANGIAVFRGLIRQPGQLPGLLVACVDTVRAMRALMLASRVLGPRFGVGAG